MTRRAGESASISCGGIRECGSYVIWFQKKDPGTFEQLLYINMWDGRVGRYSHPQKDDFSAELQGKKCSLTLRSVKESHAASYYCACYLGSTVREDLRVLDKNQLLPDAGCLWTSTSPDEDLEPGTLFGSTDLLRSL